MAQYLWLPKVLGSQRLTKHFSEVAKPISGSVVDFLCPKTLSLSGNPLFESINMNLEIKINIFCLA